MSDATVSARVRLTPRLGAWRVESRSGRVWWSAEMFDLFGVDPSSFVPTREAIARLLGPDGHAMTEQARQTLASFRETVVVHRPCGERVPVEFAGWLVGDDAVRAIYGCAREQPVAEEDLQASILRATGEGICGVDGSGRITFGNPALATLMRREGEDVRGAVLHDLVHRDHAGRELHPAAECPYRSLGGEPRVGRDGDFRRGDGSSIVAAWMGVGLECDRASPADEAAVLSFRDVTAEDVSARLLQTTLSQVRKLSSQRGELLEDIAAAQERERLRIAADIHDDTLQSLAAVALRLAGAGERAENDRDRDLLAESELEVRAVTARLRTLLVELLPPTAGRDLREQLERYGAAVLAATALDLEIVGEARDVPPETALLGYRLVQEALRNAVAHSGGTRVQVSLRRSEEQLVLRVSDDGVGLPAGEAPPTHAGLHIIRRRAESAGGTVRLGVGLHGRGTAVEVRLPLQLEDIA